MWVGNYVSKTITIRNADVQGMRAGIASPFFHSQRPELGRGDGSVAIENSYFRDYVGVVVATTYQPKPNESSGSTLSGRCAPSVGQPAH